MNTNNAFVRGVVIAMIALMLTAAANVILGTPVRDHLRGTPGDDTINGLGGADYMVGLAGNDVYIVDTHKDEVVEQVDGGTDTVRVSAAYYLPPNVENLYVASTAGGFALGNDLANRMVGNSGSDTIEGGSGNDILKGRGGADVLAGSEGNDTLTGGDGPDEFLMRGTLDGSTNVDRITDFDPEEDEIGLAFLGFWSPFDLICCVVPLRAQQFKVGASATTTLHRVIYNPQTGKLFYDYDGSGPTPKVQLAQLLPGLALTNENFLDYSHSRPL